MSVRALRPSLPAGAAMPRPMRHRRDKTVFRRVCLFVWPTTRAPPSATQPPWLQRAGGGAEGAGSPAQAARTLRDPLSGPSRSCTPLPHCGPGLPSANDPGTASGGRGSRSVGCGGSLAGAGRVRCGYGRAARPRGGGVCLIGPVVSTSSSTAMITLLRRVRHSGVRHSSWSPHALHRRRSILVDARLGTSVCQLRHDQMEQGPTEPHAGRSTFLLSSGGAGGGYY